MGATQYRKTFQARQRSRYGKGQGAENQDEGCGYHRSCLGDRGEEGLEDESGSSGLDHSADFKPHYWIQQCGLNG